MPYASFRCEVKAPLETTWSSLQSLIFEQEEGRSGATVRSVLGPLNFQELVSIDSQGYGLRLDADSEGIAGQRHFKLRGAESGAVLECILDWQIDEDSLATEVEEYIEELVRKPLIAIKAHAENP